MRAETYALAEEAAERRTEAAIDYARSTAKLATMLDPWLDDERGRAWRAAIIKVDGQLVEAIVADGTPIEEIASACRQYLVGTRR